MTSNKLALGTVAVKWFFTRDGYEVDFNAPSWKLSKDVSVRISNASQFLTDQMYESFREVLAFYAKGNSPEYVESLSYRCVHYFRAMSALPLFSVESLISYRALLGRKGEPGLAVLRTFIRKWASLGYDGIPPETIRLLDKWTLSGGDRGNPIRSMCPERGPLTDIEMDAVLTGAIDAYEAGKLSLSVMSLAMTVMVTGRRPAQITALKIGDLQSRSGKYFLNVPRAKQRNEGGWRRTFKQVPIVEDLWLLVQKQADLVCREFEMLAPVPSELSVKLPLFPNYAAFNQTEEIAAQLDSDRLHMRVGMLQEIMIKVSERISVNSERTGAPILINAYRFRYTLGTNLGREGKGEYVIAEALDHTDTQHTGVYVKNLPEIVERIDRAVAYQLAPIAQAFQGVVIKTELLARRGDDPSSRISNGTENVGSCGSYGFCGALAPVACYTCSHFQPWLDGPHEGVLEHLLQEQARVLELTGDRKVASVNDRLILAVTDVVIRCKSMKDEVVRG
ncbi:site-specific integrase [Pseudomonas sp. Irchel 3A18]|uniref:site-specific integrase n=1 Tax=Pseudomonas sp. Irchel 3A18 TaxID=2008905 RepID=UPI000BA4A15F|nr:site-specific integrase [Pseudomonas sp. Irchel 3A18]